MTAASDGASRTADELLGDRLAVALASGAVKSGLDWAMLGGRRY